MNGIGFLQMPMQNFGVFVVIMGIIVLILKIIFGFAVKDDGEKLVSKGDSLFLFGPSLWGVIVFVFGLAGLALYWAIHHSSLKVATSSNDS